MAKHIGIINVESLAYFKDNEPHDTLEITALMKLPYPAVMRRIQRLEKSKCLIRVSDPKRRPTIYKITDFGLAALGAFK